jgi:flagellar basal body-associated protein FliL
MKYIIIITVIVVATLASCTQTTCATYSKRVEQNKSSYTCATTKVDKFNKSFKY